MSNIVKLCKNDTKTSKTPLSSGDIFKINKDICIYANVSRSDGDEEEYNLISLEDGNRWFDSFSRFEYVEDLIEYIKENNKRDLMYIGKVELTFKRISNRGV